MKNIKYILIGAIIIIILFSTSCSPALLKSNEKLPIIFIYKSQGSPYGPTEGIVDIKYTFCIDLPDNVECEPYYVLWDWGDGTASDWRGPYSAGETSCKDHSWSSPGTYEIKVLIRDGCQNEYWSDPLIIYIYENSPPSKPNITGPSKGTAGVTYEWTFLSIDPEGDNITYYVDWGDKCGGAEYHGPYPSGEEVTLKHAYASKRVYIIISMAIDEHGTESELVYFKFNTPKNKILKNLFFPQVFERFQIIQLILRNIL